MRAHEPPSKIGRFVIEETLGFGASGAVYKGFDPILHRPVAIKMLRVDLLRHEGWAQTFIDRFYNEAQLVGTLSHPNIVTLFDAGETDDQTPFLAMEYADGDTVAERLENQGSFSPSEALPLLAQIASALDYAHGKGVLHRDIKPTNLILHQEGQVKITDFGIAKLMSLEADSGTLPPGKSSRLTSQGVLLGSPSYMSPEQAQGDPVDNRADVFSLGVVAFEMLTQQLPFEGTTLTATLYKLLHRGPLRPALLDELGLDGWLWDEVFNKVLAKNPEGRYPTAGAFVEALQPLLEPGVSTTARLLRASPTLTPATTEPQDMGTIPFKDPGSAPEVALPPQETRLPVRGATSSPATGPHPRHSVGSRLPPRSLRNSPGAAGASDSNSGTPRALELRAPSSRGLWWVVAGVSVAMFLLVAGGVARWLRDLDVAPPRVETRAAPVEPQQLPAAPPAPEAPAAQTREVAISPSPAPAKTISPRRVARATPRRRASPHDPVGSKAGAADVTPPRRTQWQAVRAPETARVQGKGRSVEVSFLITPLGKVEDIVVEVATGSELDQAVVEAVRNWRYVPARRKGVPMPVRERYRHSF